MANLKPGEWHLEMSCPPEEVPPEEVPTPWRNFRPGKHMSIDLDLVDPKGREHHLSIGPVDKQLVRLTSAPPVPVSAPCCPH